MNFRNPQFFTLNFSLLTSLSRTLLLLAMAWVAAGVTVGAGEKPSTAESAPVKNSQTIEQTEWIIYGQYFDDFIARQVAWQKTELKVTSDPKSVLLPSNAITSLSSKEPPLKLHHRLGGCVDVSDFEYGDIVTTKLQPELKKGTFDSFISRNKEIRKLPLGKLTIPSGRTILIVSDYVNSRTSVFGLSRVGFSRDGRQALFNTGYSFYLYQFVDGQWKQVKWFPYAVD